MDAKKIIKWGRIVVIICFLAYAIIGWVFDYTVEHPLMKGLLLFGAIILVIISVYGLYVKKNKP